MIMNEKRNSVYYRNTTFPQRKLMIETYLAAGSVKKAVEIARVSRTTFYRWRPRYEKKGEEGLENKSKRPKKLRTVSEEIAERVISMKKAHPKWGRHRIANELKKENNWEPLISPTGVRNVLIRAGLWNRILEEHEEEKSSKKEESVKADEPYKTVNVDLFFIPAAHKAYEENEESEKENKGKVEENGIESRQEIYAGEVFKKTK
jgi:transposase